MESINNDSVLNILYKGHVIVSQNSLCTKYNITATHFKKKTSKPVTVAQFYIALKQSFIKRFYPM